MDYSAGIPSPALFRLWTAITMVAASAERRIWLRTKRGPVYPNMYTFLVAPPGVGKGIITDARELMRGAVEPGGTTHPFRVAPDSTTSASVLDELAKCKQKKLGPGGQFLEYNSMLVTGEEFLVMMPSYDQRFIASLNDFYNNKPMHEEARRTGSVKELKIINPQLNVLAGIQPAIMAELFPEHAWASGLVRRVIMVYQGEGPLMDIFGDEEYVDPKGILAALGRLSLLIGEMTPEPEVWEFINEWHRNGRLKTNPSHSRLEFYNNSRTIHLVKLSMVSALCRLGELRMELIDVERGLEWLLAAESTMPDIFRAMVGKSDASVIEELHIFVLAQFAHRGKKPLHLSLIYQFLENRVPSEKAEKIVQMAERSGRIRRLAGTDDQYVPGPRTGGALE